MSPGPAHGAAHGAEVRTARFADLSAGELYALLRLRVDVFVVEQACPYPELDGRDEEPGTWHLWVPGGRGERARGYVRVLAEPGGVRRIGRVCVAPGERGSGLADQVMRAALRVCGEDEIVLAAQTPLVGWYAARGFETAGQGFLEDGIPHTPMRRAALG